MKVTPESEVPVTVIVTVPSTLTEASACVNAMVTGTMSSSVQSMYASRRAS